MKFTELARDCLLHLGKRGKSPRTVERYDYVYGFFKSYLDGHGLTNEVRHFADDQHIQRFLDWRLAGGITPNGARLELAALHTLARYGLTRRDERGRPLLTHNPVDTFGDRPDYQKPQTKFLLLHEQAAFLAVPLAPHEDIARGVLFETGLRVSEVCTPNVCDLVVQGDRYHLSVVVKGTGRRDERVYIPLSADLGERIEPWLMERRDAYRETPGHPWAAQPLLVNGEGRRWRRQTLTTMVARVARRAGITRLVVSAHVLRHTANVNARAAKLDEATRTRLLNHSSRATLARYDHLIPGELQDARDTAKAWLDEQLRRLRGDGA